MPGYKCQAEKVQGFFFGGWGLDFRAEDSRVGSGM